LTGRLDELPCGWRRFGEEIRNLVLPRIEITCFGRQSLNLLTKHEVLLLKETYLHVVLDMLVSLCSPGHCTLIKLAAKAAGVQVLQDKLQGVVMH